MRGSRPHFRIVRFSALASLAFCLGAVSAESPSFPAGDDAFGLAGTGGKAFAARFGLRYHTLEGNYTATSGTLFHSTDPAQDPDPGFSVVREVAKLNVRNDGLGEQPYWSRFPKVIGRSSELA